MSATNYNLFKEYEKWLRVATLIDFAGKYLCRKVLHDQEQLPTEGAKLYQELVGLKNKICRFKDQYDTLCPPNGITDETKFDLTLYTSIIQQKFPNKYDSLVIDLRHARSLGRPVLRICMLNIINSFLIFFILLSLVVGKLINSSFGGIFEFFIII